MKIEAAWYECSPYFYAIVALAVLFNHRSVLAIISAAILIVAATSIVKMRWKYRSSSLT